MKKRVTLISTALLIVMLLSVFSNFAFCVEAESTFEIRGDKYYLGLPLSKTPVVDDNTISANEYRFLSSLKSPIARYDIFLDDADKADGRGKYNANYDKIADGNVYTDESLKRFSKEFDSYAAYDDQYIYIAFRDLGASGEDFYSYRSNAAIDPTVLQTPAALPEFLFLSCISLQIYRNQPCRITNSNIDSMRAQAWTYHHGFLILLK